MNETAQQQVGKSVTAPLPATTNDLLKLRKLKSRRTLNDQIEDAVVVLIEDDRFSALIDATYDEQAVEGSLSADNIMAAQMIRNWAIKANNVELGQKEKLATISKALGVVLRRYNIDRKHRRDTLRGEVVPSGNDSE